MEKFRPFDTFGWLKAQSSLPHRIKQTICVVILSYILSLIMMQPFAFSSAMLVQSGGAASDYNISDFYNYIANSRAVRVLDPDVVIVDIEDFDREEIATLIDTVNAAHPAIVGIDITFIRPRVNDDHLIQSICDIKTPVLAATVKSIPQRSDTFHIEDRSYFADWIPHATTAIVSLPTKSRHGLVREFAIDFIVHDSLSGQISQEPSFAMACAEKYTSESTAQLSDNHADTEYINYPSREFMHLRFSDVAQNPELVEGKIVLLGAINDPADLHKTPIASDVSGVELHAYAISTIINRAYLHQLSPLWNWVIAFVVCFAFMFLSFSIKIGYKGLFLRIMQLILLYSIVWVGYCFFVEEGIVVDFSCTFLMITFGFFASDICIGLETLYADTKNRLIFRKSNKKTNSQNS